MFTTTLITLTELHSLTLLMELKSHSLAQWDPTSLMMVKLLAYGVQPVLFVIQKLPLTSLQLAQKDNIV
jgi:hypothetical protein